MIIRILAVAVFAMVTLTACVSTDIQLPLPPALPDTSDTESAPTTPSDDGGIDIEDFGADLYDGPLDIGLIERVDVFDDRGSLNIELYATSEQIDAYMEQSGSDPSMLMHDAAGSFVPIACRTGFNLMTPEQLAAVTDVVASFNAEGEYIAFCFLSYYSTGTDIEGGEVTA